MKRIEDTAASRAQSKDVDSYLAWLPREQRQTLEKLRKTIRAAAPMAEEKVSWQMPAYSYHGPLVFFAAFKNHLSLFPASHSIPKLFARELKRFEVSGTTIHFTPEHPLPASLVRGIVKARIEENGTRAKSKAKREKPRRKAAEPARRK